MHMAYFDDPHSLTVSLGKGTFQYFLFMQASAALSHLFCHVSLVFYPGAITRFTGFVHRYGSLDSA
jgi:hypothetical protein